MGGIYGGYLQGQQQQQQLAEGALRIKQQQQALDQEKQKLAAAAAMFQGLSSPSGPQPQQPPPQGTGPAPQSPMPGQPSMPAQPQQGAAPGGPPGAPQGQMPAVPPELLRQLQGPQGAGGGPPPQGAPAQAPQPPQGGGQPPPGGQQPQPGQSQATTILQGLAQRLKASNPNADPATLSMALEQQIGLMRGVQPDLKDQMTLQIAEMRNQTALSKIQQDAQNAIMKAESAQQVAEIRAQMSQQIADLVSGDRRRGQDINSEDRAASRETSERNTDARVGAETRGQDIRADTGRRGQDIRSGDTERGQDLRSADQNRALDIRLQQVRDTKEYRDAVSALRARGLSDKEAQDAVKNKLSERSLDIREDQGEQRIGNARENADTKRQLGLLANDARNRQIDVQQLIGMGRIDTQRDIAGMRNDTARRGQDISSADRGAARDVTERGQDLRSGEGQLRAQHQAGIDSVRGINSQISDLLHGRSMADLSVPEKTQLQALQGKRETAVNQLVSAGLKKPEIVSALKKAPSVADKPSPAAAAPAAAGKYQVGQVIDGPDGKKYRVTGGDPNDPDVEPVQ